MVQFNNGKMVSNLIEFLIIKLKTLVATLLKVIILTNIIIFKRRLSLIWYLEVYMNIFSRKVIMEFIIMLCIKVVVLQKLKISENGQLFI